LLELGEETGKRLGVMAHVILAAWEEEQEDLDFEASIGKN
jgi:hypothetical protein